MILWSQLIPFFQVVLIDLSMAADNALVVGMAASGLPAKARHKAFVAGIGAATLLRIIFAFFAIQMLKVTGLMVAGGLLLIWVAWKMYEELRSRKPQSKKGPSADLSSPSKSLSSAIRQIIIADISMSFDNVIGVAGVARGHVGIMVAGLVISVVMMGFASTLIARLAARHSWLIYLGIAVVLNAALHMIGEGVKPFLN